MSKSPIPMKKEGPKPYEITLVFDEKAQLIDVVRDETMEKALLIEHLAVAMQFVAQTIRAEVK